MTARKLRRLIRLLAVALVPLTPVSFWAVLYGANRLMAEFPDLFGLWCAIRQMSSHC